MAAHVSLTPIAATSLKRRDQNVIDVKVFGFKKTYQHTGIWTSETAIQLV